MARPAIPELTALLGHLALSAAAGQRALNTALDVTHAGALTGLGQIGTTTRVTARFVLGEEHARGFKIGIWPLNIGAAVMHGWRREHASEVTFDIVLAPAGPPYPRPEATAAGNDTQSNEASHGR